jgi:putative membrane protein
VTGPTDPITPGEHPLAGTPRRTPGTGQAQDGEWQRLHPATPFLKSWGAIVALLMVGAYNLRDDLPGVLERAGQIGWHWLGLGFAAFMAIAFIWAFISWRRAHFRIADSSLELAAGVIFRQRRTVRLDRIEAVDIIRPLVPRLFGLVKLKIEAAGGSGSAVELAYLKVSDAARWRQIVLSRAAAARLGEAVTTTDQVAPILALGTDRKPVGAEVAPSEKRAEGDQTASSRLTPPKSAETQVGEFLGDADASVPELFAVPTKWVLLSLALSPMTWGLVLVLIAGLVTLIWGRLGESVFALVPALLGLGSYVWQQFISTFGFSAKATDRGLTLSHGLTTRVSQTIAPGRVVAVELSQGPIFRRFGWWRAEMNVAGYGAEDTDKQSVLVPIGQVETIRRAIWAVSPELAQPGGWDLVTAAMTGKGPAPGFTAVPRRARLFDPLAWKRKGFTTTDEMLILRLGALTRTVTLVPHARIQGLTLDCGPWDKRRDLASVTIHSPEGPVTPRITHLTTADAAALVAGESGRLNAAMRQALLPGSIG